MKIAVLADPHGNLMALRAVLNKIEQIGPDEIIIAGDIVGYGPYPKEVIEETIRIDPIAIRGNHDNAVVKRDYTWMNTTAAIAAEWTANILDKDSIEYLSSLNFEREIEIADRKIGIYHGSPDDPDEYVDNEKRARTLLDRSEMDIIICGHTHVPMMIEEKDRIFLNPGGVGQPRDGNPYAAFAIIDFSTREVNIHRTPYDISTVQKKMMKEGLPEILASRLSIGR